MHFLQFIIFYYIALLYTIIFDYIVNYIWSLQYQFFTCVKFFHYYYILWFATILWWLLSSPANSMEQYLSASEQYLSASEGIWARSVGSKNDLFVYLNMCKCVHAFISVADNKKIINVFSIYIF